MRVEQPSRRLTGQQIGYDMTKKDFELIADLLHNAGLHWLSSEDHRRTCEHFATRLGFTNPRFDRNKFLQACGIETERKMYKGTQFESDED